MWSWDHLQSLKLKGGCVGECSIWQGVLVFVCFHVLGCFVVLITTETAGVIGLLVEKEGNSGWTKHRFIVISDHMESWVQNWNHPNGAALWPRDTELIPLPWEWVGSVPLFYLSTQLKSGLTSIWKDREGGAETQPPPLSESSRDFDGYAILPVLQKSYISFPQYKFTRKAYEAWSRPNNAWEKLWATKTLVFEKAVKEF